MAVFHVATLNCTVMFWLTMLSIVVGWGGFALAVILWW